MPEGLLPHQQHISDVSAQNHSQAFAGSARDVYFGASKPEDPQKELEQACRNALFLTNPAVDRETLITTKGTRVAGTCEWITRHEKYQQWLCGNIRLLWISGGPGKGKTMMSIFLTEELERHMNDANLAYFFCSAQDEKRNTGIAILRGLIFQIITKRPQLVKHALQDFETPEQTQQTLSSFEALWLVFKKLVVDEALGTMLCVLDGLDECHEDTFRLLMPRIVKLLCCEGSARDSRRRIAGLRLVVVSREIPGLQNCERVRLDPDNDENVTSDIQRVVSTRMNELSHILGFDDTFHRTVERALLQRAEGTFLWVGFAVHELSQKQTCSQVLEVLKSLPKGLPEIYRRMLLQIPTEERQITSSILRWVTLALRPLTPIELAFAVGVQSPHQLICVEQTIREKIALCGPLLKMENRKIRVYEGEISVVERSEVSLVHQSARDYLLRKEEDGNAVLEAYRIIPQNGHLKILQSCFDRIAQSDFQQRVVDLFDKSISQDSPLLEYAAFHWPEHAKGCATRDPDLLQSLRHFFKVKRSVRKNWWAAYRIDIPTKLAEVLPLLHMVCYLGLEPSVQAAIASDKWRPSFLKRMKRRDSQGKTALHLGVLGGSKAIVQLLVNNGAEVNAKDKKGNAALHSAFKKYDREMMQLLIHKGADVDARNMSGEVILHLAVCEEIGTIVQLLIDSMADIEARNDSGETALHMAIERKNEDIAQLLVERGADVRATDNYGRTVLHCAAGNNNEFAVRLLLGRGVDVEAKDNFGRTVLHCAIGSNNEVMLGLLVDGGADVTAKDAWGKTVLHYAVKQNNEFAIRLFLDEGVDFSVKDAWGKTVLHYAVTQNNESAVRLFLDKGADVRARDYCGRTVLHHIVEESNEGIVRLLIDRADVRGTDHFGKTVLHTAVEKHNEFAVRLLVDKGADVRARDNDGWTVLHEVVLGLERDRAMVQLLVVKGVNIEEKDIKGRTALVLAAEAVDVWRKNGQKMDEETLRVLVSLGADVNAKINDGWTALHYAVMKGYDTVINMLLERGANVRAKTSNGWTPLHAAIGSGNKELVQRLKAHLEL